MNALSIPKPYRPIQVCPNEESAKIAHCFLPGSDFDFVVERIPSVRLPLRQTASFACFVNGTRRGATTC